MTDAENPEEPTAKVQRRYLTDWIWLIPVAAVLVVLWIGWRQLASEGPAISIVFASADDIQIGSKVRHNAVDIGTVKTITLTQDLSHVVVTARMNRQVSGHLGSDTQFWIVRPRLSPNGISGLETIVSGAYIEMQPGKKKGSQHRFKGLDQPPLVPIGVAGSTFRLKANQVRSLNPGSPLYYRGIDVGRVTGYELADRGAWINLFVFVRAPYDKLVHHESLFWNVSAVSVSTSGGGLTANAASLESLFAGGIAFDTSNDVLNETPSQPGTRFPLYNDEASARSEPVGPRIYYLVNFPGSISGISSGSPVELRGIEVGHVTDAHLEYDRATHTLLTPVTLELHPQAIRNLAVTGDKHLASAVNDALGHLVAQGMRARLSSSNLLTGQRKISLELVPDAPPAQLLWARGLIEIPTTPSGDLDELTRTANQAVAKVNRLLSSPETKRSLKALSDTLANLDQISKEANRQTGPLLANLRKASEQATATMKSVNRSIGGESGQTPDITRAIDELANAARSIRILADYLDRHPEALLRGRSGSHP
jgi:paraquat-inducible protein B